MNISEEHYETDNITVTVQWTQQVGVTYSIKVSPLVPILVSGGTSHRLIISYNTEYNFSVEAVGPCRPNATVIIRLRYGMVILAVVWQARPFSLLSCEGEGSSKVTFNY